MSSFIRSPGLSIRNRKSRLHLFSDKIADMTLKASQSSSLAMAQFIRSYNFLLVACNNRVSILYEISSSNNGMLLKSGSTVIQGRWKLHHSITKIHDVLSPVCRKQALSFSIFEIVCYGRSRSFNVIEIGTNQKPICDFLLVFHYNCMPIFLSRFLDTVHNDLLVEVCFFRRFGRVMLCISAAYMPSCDVSVWPSVCHVRVFCWNE